MSNSLDSLELIARTAGVTAALILAMSLARSPGASVVGRLCGALLCCGVAAYLPCSMRPGLCAAPALLPVVLLASGVPFFFWAWTSAIMDDDFRLRPLAGAAAAALVGLPFAVRAIGFDRCDDWSVIVHSVLGIAFVVAALATVLRTWREDLIESRRRLRLAVLIVTGGYSLVVMIIELIHGARPPSPALQLVNAIAISILLLILSGSLLGVSERFRAAVGWIAPTSRARADVQPAAVEARDMEQELLDRLHGLMTGKALYRDPSLSVAKLAGTLGVPEKKLRLLINGRLGHKNFPSYVNAFRLEEVRMRLCEARHDHVPILTLALDAGFGSVVVFNRAFKERFATTPTHYRAMRAAPAPSP